MTQRAQGIEDIWTDGPPVVGMVHLPPLPGAPMWGGSMAAVLHRAVADARALEDAGFHGLMVENYADVPFFGASVPPETVAAMTAVAGAVIDDVAIPVGINVLRNDAHAAVAIAAATGARFVRINVHTGSMFTDQGLLEGRAADTLRLRSALQVDVAVLADVHVKHGTAPTGASIGSAASDAWHRGLADALIVSGTKTGGQADVDDLEAVRRAVPQARVLVGSGVTPETVAAYRSGCDGLIVGSAVMHDGRAGAGVDPVRATRLMEAAFD